MATPSPCAAASMVIWIVSKRRPRSERLGPPPVMADHSRQSSVTLITCNRGTASRSCGVLMVFAKAGAQTGIYPADTPGGWQLIGRTPIKPFDANRAEPFLMKPGDAVQFYAVDPDEFERRRE